MHAKPSSDLSQLVAAVGLTLSTVVWTDPGCIDLLIVHGSTRVDGRAETAELTGGGPCRARPGRNTVPHVVCMRADAVKGSERKTQHTHEVDSQAILLQGRGLIGGWTPGVSGGVPCRHMEALVDSYTYRIRASRRVTTEAVGVSVRGASGGSCKLWIFLSRGCVPGVCGPVESPIYSIQGII